MIEIIPRYFAAPVFEGQEGKSRVASLLNVIVLSSFLGAILYLSFASRQRLPYILVAMILILAVWVTLKRGYVQAASIAMVLGLSAVFAVTIFTGGGVQAPAFSGLIVVILIAGLLLGQKAVASLTVLSLLYGAALLRMGSLGWLPPATQYSDVGYLIIECVFFLMTGVLLSLSLRLVQEAFERARQELEDRRLAENALRESEERFYKAFHSSPAAINMTRVKESVFIEANKSFETLVGFEREEMIGRTPFELKIFPDMNVIASIRERLMKNDTVRNYEMEIQTRSGEARQVLFSTEPIILKNETHYVTTIIDITERKQAEKALSENEARLQSIIDNEPECVKVLDLDGRLLEMNPAGLAMIGAENLAHVVGHEVANLALEEHRAAFTGLTRAVSSGKSGTLTFEIEGLKGTRRWLETHAVPLRNAEGTIIALLGITRDITDRKKADEALENRERYFRALIENNSDAIAVISAEGKLVYQSPSSLKILGIDPAELEAKDVFAFIHPEDHAAGVSLFRQLSQNPSKPVTAEIRYRHNDGQ